MPASWGTRGIVWHWEQIPSPEPKSLAPQFLSLIILNAPNTFRSSMAGWLASEDEILLECILSPKHI